MASNAGDFIHYRHPGPFQHHFYVVAIPTSQTKRDPRIFRQEINIENLTAILSLFFGKRIMYHGFIYLYPIWCLPELQNIRPNPYYLLPQYSGKHRKEPKYKPDWREIKTISPCIEELTSIHNKTKKITVAARAYAESLRLLPFDRELSYFRLIQAIESIVDSDEYTDTERFSHDKDLMRHIRWLENLDDPNGKKTAAFMRKRLHQIKRVVWLWLSNLITHEFYSKDAGAISAENLKQTLSAAYDLRSMYVITGQRFGEWIDPSEGRCENQETVPHWMEETCQDKNLWKILRKAPSFLGLERIVRFSLLKSMKVDNSI